MATPTLATFARQQAEQRERQMQTSFPVKVIEYDSNTGTVTVEPQFIEAWRDGEERVTEDIQSREDAYIANVPIAFPRSGDFAITWPVAADEFGFVTCTKYSLDTWRKAGTAGDPGDLRRFTMSGAVYHPVNLYPDDVNVVHDGGDYISISKGGTVDFVALKADVDAIKAELDKIETTFGSIIFTVDTSGGTGTPGLIGTAYSNGYSVTASQKTKVE